MLLLCDPTMQGLGSAITYSRRYALTAYLDLTIDEDDDGVAANTPTATSQSTSQQPTAAEPKPASAKQRTMLEAVATERALSPGDFANVVLVTAGEPPRVWQTDEHADQTLKRLLDKLPASLVTAVKTGIFDASAWRES